MFTANGRRIEIPKKFGMIRSSLALGNKTVVYIQDLHCNYEVQMNIAGIIRNLVENNGLPLVLIEGASYPVNTAKLGAFPEKTVRRQAGQWLVKQGQIGGPEYYAATTDASIWLEGIENRDLYENNRQTVREFLNAESQGLCFDLRSALDEIKPGIYHAQLRHYDAQRMDFRKAKISLAKYCSFLAETSRQCGVNLDAFPNLKIFLRAQQTIFPVSLDSDGLYLEIDTLDANIREQLYQNDDQRLLDDLYRRLDLIEKLLNISASADEVALWQEQPQKFKTGQFLQFIKKNDRQGDFDLEQEAPVLDAYLQKVATFYREADLRSKYFAANTLAAMDRKGATLAVLVTGGFHAQGVLQEFQQQGVSAVSVLPRVSEPEVLNPYFGLLQNRRTPLENLLAKNQNLLALPLKNAEVSAEHAKLVVNEGNVAHYLAQATPENIRRVTTFCRLVTLLCNSGLLASLETLSGWEQAKAEYLAVKGAYPADFKGLEFDFNPANNENWQRIRAGRLAVMPLADADFSIVIGNSANLKKLATHAIPLFTGETGVGFAVMTNEAVKANLKLLEGDSGRAVLLPSLRLPRGTAGLIAMTGLGMSIQLGLSMQAAWENIARINFTQPLALLKTPWQRMPGGLKAGFLGGLVIMAVPTSFFNASAAAAKEFIKEVNENPIVRTLLSQENLNKADFQGKSFAQSLAEVLGKIKQLETEISPMAEAVRKVAETPAGLALLVIAWHRGYFKKTAILPEQNMLKLADDLWKGEALARKILSGQSLEEISADISVIGDSHLAQLVRSIKQGKHEFTLGDWDARDRLERLLPMGFSEQQVLAMERLVEAHRVKVIVRAPVLGKDTGFSSQRMEYGDVYEDLLYLARVRLKGNLRSDIRLRSLERIIHLDKKNLAISSGHAYEIKKMEKNAQARPRVFGNIQAAVEETKKRPTRALSDRVVALASGLGLTASLASVVAANYVGAAGIAGVLSLNMNLAAAAWILGLSGAILCPAMAIPLLWLGLRLWQTRGLRNQPLRRDEIAAGTEALKQWLARQDLSQASDLNLKGDWLIDVRDVRVRQAKSDIAYFDETLGKVVADTLRISGIPEMERLAIMAHELSHLKESVKRTSEGRLPPSRMAGELMALRLQTRVISRLIEKTFMKLSLRQKIAPLTGLTLVGASLVFMSLGLGLLPGLALYAGGLSLMSWSLRKAALATADLQAKPAVEKAADRFARSITTGVRQSFFGQRVLPRLAMFLDPAKRPALPGFSGRATALETRLAGRLPESAAAMRQPQETSSAGAGHTETPLFDVLRQFDARFNRRLDTDSSWTAKVRNMNALGLTSILFNLATAWEVTRGFIAIGMLGRSGKHHPVLYTPAGTRMRVEGMLASSFQAWMKFDRKSCILFRARAAGLLTSSGVLQILADPESDMRILMNQEKIPLAVFQAKMLRLVFQRAQTTQATPAIAHDLLAFAFIVAPGKKQAIGTMAGKSCQVPALIFMPGMESCLGALLQYLDGLPGFIPSPELRNIRPMRTSPGMAGSA